MNGYEACTGCGICVLPCPVWHETHDLTMTLQGRALALQGGASPEDVKESLLACVVCGACEPVCPEDIDTVGMTLDLRTKVRMDLPDGADIAAAIEAGAPVDPERKAKFLRGFDGKREIVVKQGILHQPLRRWLPNVRVIGLGESLLRRPEIRTAIRPTDLYVIETRGYHADFDRLAPFYDELRQQTGCEMNLDLQRAAMATGASSLQSRLGLKTASLAQWIIEDRKFDRIVVECSEDQEAFERITKVQVIHLSEIGS